VDLKAKLKDIFGLKILDRYILKQYLVSFVFVVVLLVAVICVIDYTEKNENFLTKNVSAREIFLVYYANFIPYLVNILSPLIVFITTVFVTARLASRTEIIAILSSGTSFVRILKPYLIGSMMISIVIFYMHGYLIPRANKIRHQFENTYIRSQYYYDERNIHIKIAPNTFLYMESYNNTINCGYQVTLEYIDSGRVKEKLSASRLIWDKDLEKWRLEFWTRHTFEGLYETQSRGDRMDTVLNIHPSDFATQHLMNEQLTIDELDMHIKKLKDRGAENVEPYLIEKYERYTYPFAIIILSIIGVIVASRKTREGIGLQIALGFLLAFVYIITIIVSRSVANTGNLPPELSAWVPNIIFGVIGIIMYFRVPK
jgi:lipopolysaccharide export system permease protein